MSSLGQSRRHSLFESLTNVVVGFGISTAANMIVLPWFGFAVDLKGATGIGGVLTIVSIARSYALRRFYNWFHLKSQHRTLAHAERNIHSITPIRRASRSK